MTNANRIVYTVPYPLADSHGYGYHERSVDPAQGGHMLGFDFLQGKPVSLTQQRCPEKPHHNAVNAMAQWTSMSLCQLRNGPFL